MIYRDSEKERWQDIPRPHTQEMLSETIFSLVEGSIVSASDVLGVVGAASFQRQVRRCLSPVRSKRPTMNHTSIIRTHRVIDIAIAGSGTQVAFFPCNGG